MDLIGSNIKKMTFLLEQPNVLQFLSQNNHDTIQFGKDIDFLRDVMVIVYHDTWCRFSSSEKGQSRYLFKEIYLEKLSVLKEFEIDNNEFLSWLLERQQ